MGPQTTLIGYSRKHDRVIQYPVELEILRRGKKTSEVRHWVDALFATKPLRPGYWRYEMDYRGRAGPLDQYEIKYDARRELFTGKLTEAGGEE